MSQNYIWSLVDLIAAILIITTALKFSVVLELALPVMVILALKGGYHVIKDTKFTAIIYLTSAIVLALSYTSYLMPSVAIFFSVFLFIKSSLSLVNEVFR